MKGVYIIIGAICFILAGLAGADYIATTISTDGSVLLAASGEDTNGSLGSQAMATDCSRVSQSVSGENGLQTDLSLRGSGPVLFSDYASGIGKHPALRDLCAFLEIPNDRDMRESSLYSSGILRSGEVDISRSVGSSLFGMTAVNGTGMLRFGSQSRGNRSMESQGFVSGNLSVNDLVQYGG